MAVLEISKAKWPMISGAMLIRLWTQSKECLICIQTFPPIISGLEKKKKEHLEIW